MPENLFQKKLLFQLLRPLSENNVPEERAIAEVPLAPDQSLESGMILPKSYRSNYPKSFFGLPIVDIDDYYKDKKTFVVIGSNWEIYRFSSEKSLIFLESFNCIRCSVIRTICHTIFRYFMIIAMLSFMIFWDEVHYNIIRVYFVIVFNLEMNLKLIAYGAVRHPFSYFRNIWNWLDLIILITMTTSLFIQPHSISVLNAIESLRAIKLIQLFPLARLTLKAAFKNVLLLKDLMIAFLFVYLMATLLTLNSYSGLLRNRCQPDPVDWSPNATSVQNQFTYLCGNITGSTMCPANYTCVADRGENPDQGLTSFDHFGQAALTTFRMMLKDFVEELYNDLHKTIGPHPIVFFLIIIFINLLFNNLFASFVAIGATRFIQQLNAINSNDSKIISEQTIDKSATLPAFPDNGHSSIAEVEVVSTRPTTINASAELANDENYKTPSKLVKCWQSFVDVVWGWSCCGCCSPCQRPLERFLYHRYFERYIYTVVGVTIFGELFNHHAIPRYFYDIITVTITIIDCLLILEVVLKIIALNPRRFFADGWNRLDFFLSFAVIFKWFLESGVGFGFMPLRIIRALRITRSWTMSRSILKIHKVSVWMVFIAMMSLAHVGTALFFHHYVGTPHRWNFVNDLESFLVVFRAFAGEWIENLLPLMAMADHPWLACIYFIVVIIFSYVLVTHLFLQLVLTILDTSSLFETDHHMTNKNSPSIWRQISSCFNRNRNSTNDDGAEQSEGILRETNTANNFIEAQDEDNGDPAPCCWDWCNKKTSFRSLTTPETTSCWSVFRRRALIWSNNNIWKAFITTIIILSCIPYLFPIPNIHVYIDYVVAAIFTIEIAIQITGEGFKTYLSNSWTRFDGCITLIHLILNAFSVVNPLRILRLIPRLERLKVVIASLFYRKALLIEAITVTFFVWLLFAIEGNFMFDYIFYSCQNESGEILHNVLFHMCNETVVAHNVNFDNVFNSFIALLQFATFKGWIGIWHHIETFEFHQELLAVYFLGFVLMGGFVCLVIIVSSFIIQSNAHRKEIGGGYIEILMTLNQRKQLAIKRKHWFLVPEKLITPAETGSLRFASDFVSSKFFDLFSIILLLANAIVLGFNSHVSYTPNWNDNLIFYAESILVAAFAIELGLQLFVYRKSFFQNSWNVYNFIIVIAVLLTLFIPHLQVYLMSPTLCMWLLLFRLVRWLKWIKRIALMVRICLPAILNVGCLMSIILFFFSVAAMQLFAHVTPHKIHNFQSFFSANSVLFEITFFGAWDGLYDRMANDGNLAALFVISYIIICFFLFISSGTVIFLENCFHLQEKLRLGIENENLENFKEMWKIFDPDVSGALSFDDLPDFLHYLEPPFQVEKPNDLKIRAMQFPVSKDNTVKFSDVLQNLIYHLDKEKKVPKPMLLEDETNPSNSSRRVQLREKVTQFHNMWNWCRQKHKKFEEIDELASDH